MHRIYTYVCPTQSIALQVIAVLLDSIELIKACWCVYICTSIRYSAVNTVENVCVYCSRSCADV